MLAWLYALACSLVECHQMRVCIVSSCFNRFLTGTMNCIASKESGKRLIASQPERKRTLHKNNQRNKKNQIQTPQLKQEHVVCICGKRMHAIHAITRQIKRRYVLGHSFSTAAKNHFLAFFLFFQFTAIDHRRDAEKWGNFSPFGFVHTFAYKKNLSVNKGKGKFLTIT